MRPSMPPLVLCALTAVAAAAPNLIITNGPATAFQPVVAVEAAPDLPSALVTPWGQVVPVQVTANGQALVLVPDLLEPGETLQLRPAMGQTPGPTDLVVARDESSLTVRNSFMGLTFPRRGNGGLPTAVEYPISGHVERDFAWMDRLFAPGQGELFLWQDKEATTEVVEEGPVQVTVQARARYLKNGTPVGNSRVIYRWTFRAYSPVILFSAHVQREDDFAWPELHILQISRRDDRLRHWAGESDTLASGPLRDDNTARTFTRWAALDDGENAVGLAWEGKPVIMYDGRSSYVYYLQHCEAFSTPSYDLSGRVYFGPALTPERYREEIMPGPQIAARWEEPPPPVVSPRTAKLLTVGNGSLTIGFTPDTFGCASLREAGSGHEFLRMGDASPLTWRLRFQGPGNTEVLVDSNAPARRSHEISADGARLRLRWEDISVGDEPGTVTVVVQVLAEHGADRVYWFLEVENGSERHSLLNVHFPCLVGLSDLASCRSAVPRSNWGRLHQGMAHVSGSYPSADWPMQFLSVHDGDSGLYLGFEDPRNFTKSFRLDPGEEFHFDVLAEDATRPGNDYSSPGPVAMAACGKSWWRAAKMYRQWALNQAWTREGPLTQRASTPEFCKQLGLWYLDGADAQTVISNMRKAADFLGVPVGMHWYCWHRWPFDTHYPDYFPAIPDFKIAIDALVPEGKVIMPYINGRIVDKTVEAYAEFIPWAAKDPSLNTYTEVYGNGVQQAPMCPATDFWQQRIADICERLIGEYGVNGIYIDQIGAAAPAPCYDPSHGHPLGGGSHWVDGYRVLLQRVQDSCHRNGRSVLITTENNAEPYMDGVDCFLIWNPRLPDEIPMMTAVYSGYSLYFASNAQCGPGLQPYAMIQGRDFLWGSQPGWMGFEDAGPTERGNYLRQLVRLRHAALKYVVFGELMGELEPVGEVGTVTGQWFGWGGGAIPATLPAVMATVWRGSDGTLGLLFANLSGSTRRFTYELDPEHYGGVAGAGQYLALTSISKEGNVPCGFSPGPVLRRTETLQPWEARVLELRRVSSAVELTVPQDLQETPLARQFRLEAWGALNGVQWEITPPAGTASPGDYASALIQVRGATLQAQAWVEFGDGSRVFTQLNPDPLRPEWLTCTIPVEVPASLEPGETRTGELHLKLDHDHEVVSPFTIQIVPPLEVRLETPEGAFRAGESGILQVVLRNRALRHWPAGTRVAITAPESWDLWPGRCLSFGALAPDQETVALVRCTLPEGVSAGATRVRAHVIQVQDSRSVSVAPPRPQFRALHLTPTVDGDLSEWQGLPAIVLGPDQAAHAKDYTGEADLSARVWVGTDEHYLYLAADVTDDRHVQNGQQAAMWEGDCIQVSLRPGPPPKARGYDRVVELGLALTPVGPQLWQWMPREGLVTGGQITVVRDGDHTRYEAAVPWSALPGIAPTTGSVVAFSITVNESDAGSFEGWLEWTPGICGTKDASCFGRLIW